MKETCSGVSDGTLPNGDASLRTEGPMPWARATLPGEADAPLDTVRATTGMTAAAATTVRRRLDLRCKGISSRTVRARSWPVPGRYAPGTGQPVTNAAYRAK